MKRERCCWETGRHGVIWRCVRRVNKGGIYCDAHCAESERQIRRKRAKERP